MLKIEHEIITEQIGYDLDVLRSKTILITGALGMISSYVVDLIHTLNSEKQFGIKLVLLGRSIERLHKRFPVDVYDADYLEYDISERFDYKSDVDYIFHFAGNSSPYHIMNSPMDIIRSNVIGSLNVVEFAKTHKVKRVIFSSTREVYGDLASKDGLIKEDDFGSFDPLDDRSCYPESKRMAENIFKSASIEYGVEFNIVRIAHSYGPGMAVSDGRVMADFVGNAVKNQDIRLLSDGEALRSFCYVGDCVSAIFAVLVKGHSGTAYNIANEKEEIKIYELAKKIANYGQQLKVSRVQPKENSVYCSYKRVGLNTDKIEFLGWSPKFDLNYGINQTMRFLRSAVDD